MSRIRPRARPACTRFSCAAEGCCCQQETDAVMTAAASVAAAPINATLVLVSIALGCFSSRCDDMTVQPHCGSPLVRKSVSLLRQALVLESSSCWCESGSRGHKILSTGRREDPPSKVMVIPSNLIAVPGSNKWVHTHKGTLPRPISESKQLLGRSVVLGKTRLSFSHGRKGTGGLIPPAALISRRAASSPTVSRPYWKLWGTSKARPEDFLAQQNRNSSGPASR